MRIALPAVLLPFLFACSAAQRPATPDEPSTLAAMLRAHLAGDPSGACFAAAVIERERVERAFVCARAEDEGRIGPHTAFEIGSLAKTMTAALLAELVLEGKASLDDPLQVHLPAGTTVPAFDGQPILLRHVVTHTSGLPRLPPGFAPPNLADPYAALGPDELLATLSGSRLERAPGAAFEYSNYASMVLSLAVGAIAGAPFDALVRARLFEPLGMHHAHVGEPPPGVRAAQGHDAMGRPVPPWNFHPALAGVGGVRATLDDMIAFARAHLGLVETPLRPALRLTHRVLREGHPRVAMNWMVVSTPSGETFVHEGGTGGFSSFMGLVPAAGRAAIVLSDTALLARGGLGAIGMRLLEPAP